LFLSYPPTAVGGRVLYKFADEKEKEMHRCRETKAMVSMLSQYKNLCGTRKVMLHYPSIQVWFVEVRL
jgi:hypothetical protein